MKLAQFAKEFLKENSGVKACYIAVMDNDGKYDLEVEVNEGSIGGVFATNSSSLMYARDLADVLDSALCNSGVRVFQDRKSWESFLASEADA